MVLLNTINFVNSRPYVKFLLRWEGLFKVIRVEFYIVYFALLINIKCLLVFYISIVQLWFGKGLLGQSTLLDVRVNDGCVMIRMDDQEKYEEWAFKKFIDCVQLGGNLYWYYYVKWKIGNLIWEPVSNVIDCEYCLQQFYCENLDKLVPLEVQNLLYRFVFDVPAPVPAPEPPR